MSGEHRGTIKGDPSSMILEAIRECPRLGVGTTIESIAQRVASALDWGRRVVLEQFIKNPRTYRFVEDNKRGGLILFVNKTF